MERTKKRLGAAVAVLLAGTLAGCGSEGLSAHGETAAMLPEMMQYVDPQAGSNPGAASVRGPIRVALGQVGEIAPPQAMLDQFRGRPDLFARVEPISVIALPSEFSADQQFQGSPVLSRVHEERQAAMIDQMARLRTTATNLGMDYVLVFGGSVDHGHQATGLSILDFTIVGAFIVPSTGIAVGGKAAGSLIDARTGQIAFTCSSESEGHGVSPSAFVDTAETVSVHTNRQELVQKLTADAIRQMEYAIADSKAVRK